MSDSPNPDSSNPYSAPVKSGEPLEAQMASQQGDATGGVIPYKNPKALIAYYLGIFSLLFFPLGIVSIVLGILGLRDRKRNPAIKGSVHAWIGIVLGFLGLVCGGGVVTMAVIGLVNSQGP